MSEVNWNAPIKATVGIPTMNNALTIERSLRQLQKQTRLPDRVIIVDNSSDSTQNIIENISTKLDFSVDIYQQPRHGRGVGAARDKIHQQFDGDLLLCLDTNNSVNNKWVETHIKFHKNNPSYGVLSNSSDTGVDRSIQNPLRSEYFGQSNCSIKKSALEVTDGWDPWFHRGEDWDLRIRLWTAGVKSWAKNDIASNRFEQNVTSEIGSWFRTKVLFDPSSVQFLRKYGLWYIRFHPLHVIGDFASIVGIISLLLAPIGMLVNTLLTVIQILIPLLLSIGFMYYKGPRKRGKFIPAANEVGSLLVFYALGLSAIKNLMRIGKHEDWNYKGFDKSIKK